LAVATEGCALRANCVHRRLFRCRLLLTFTFNLHTKFITNLLTGDHNHNITFRQVINFDWTNRNCQLVPFSDKNRPLLLQGKASPGAGQDHHVVSVTVAKGSIDAFRQLHYRTRAAHNALLARPCDLAPSHWFQQSYVPSLDWTQHGPPERFSEVQIHCGSGEYCLNNG